MREIPLVVRARVCVQKLTRSPHGSKATTALCRKRALAALAFAVLSVRPVAADVTPVSSELALSANAAIGSVVPLVELQPTDSQGATLNNLNVSVTNSLVYPAGNPILDGSACNPSATYECVSVIGQEAAAWTSAAQGTLTFTNYGWYDHSPTDGGTGNLIPLNPTQQFTYDFIADIAGTMDVHYTVSYTGTSCFGMRPFDVIVSGGSGTAPEGSAGLTDTCGSVSGNITGSITPGGHYSFFIKNQSNASAGIGDRNAVINATFDFTIPSSALAPVPEPAPALLFTSGLVGAALFGRRRKELEAG